MKQTNPAKRYINSLNSAQSKITMRSLLNNSVRFISSNDTISTFDWSTLSYDMVIEIRDKLKRKNTKIKNGIKKTISPATVNSYFAALKGAAKQAWKLGIIEKDEYEEIRDIPRAKGKREPPGRALKPKELNTLIDYCMSQDGPIGMRDAALIALIYGAGLRRTEATMLAISDYSRRKGELTILGKGDKERINGLNDRIIDIIECWLDERGREPGAIFVRVYKGGKVSNEPISGQTVYDVIVRRYKQAGLKSLSPHDLRRSFATNLLDQGEDVFTVQDLMGHASSDTTKKYDKRKKSETIRASKRLSL